ncbi:hypothetical protein B0T24DRAFT_346589 [Lasiosphaeria ovina]|uniref:Rhodopsin domain-containing protein n=1 Tax=Lasiosphaeria ovina TaxID=92902 RepID=A0AAE0K2Q2_9PEZI|nr:hypothetical protein B0T24DRAFT_346589 [Lasiosphaeria ovina]
MSLYSEPPPLRTFSEDKPTLLVCWWITIFCAVIILLRVGGRFVRTERLFTEDKVAALALIPLFLRMGSVHVILVYGTNNAQLDGAGFSYDELHRKSVASGLVLLSRILYAATLWILKNAILEFFRRLNVSWERSFDVALLSMRCILVATFVAVVISDLAECQPFSHYWQVLPDPGGQCRQGYAQLLTMATCNIITDLLLVFFPIPIIISSQMSAKRKVQLVLLFSLSLGVVAVTIYRVPHIIWDGGSQQSRSLYASIELLFATAAANSLVLGSFVRDRGIKKKKFKYDSVAAGSLERSSATESRRPTMNKHWGSDEDLVRDVGYGVKPDLREPPPSPSDIRFYTPAPMANAHDGMNFWQFPGQKRASGARSDDVLMAADQLTSTRSNSVISPRKVSFFDHGGLLDDQGGSSRRASLMSANDPASGGSSAPSPTVPASAHGLRRGSTALLQELGGLLSPLTSKSARPKLKSDANSRSSAHKPTGEEPPSPPPPPPPPPSPPAYSAPKQEPVLADVGGLLGSDKE